MSKVLGIDLGTTNCCLGYYENNNFRIICSENGKRLIQACVFYNPTDGSISVGELLYLQCQGVQNLIFDVKRIIGKRYNDPFIQENLKFWPFLNQNPNNDFCDGTFDVSLVQFQLNGSGKVIHSQGEPQLGGRDFDNALMNYILHETKGDLNMVANKKSKYIGRRLRSLCRDIKESLSDSDSYDLHRKKKNVKLMYNLFIQQFLHIKYEQCVGNVTLTKIKCYFKICLINYF